MKLTVKPQIFNGIPSFGIFHGEVFIAYAMTRLRAHLAGIEIEKTLARDPRFRRTVKPDPSIPIKPLTFQDSLKVERASRGERFNESLYQDIRRVQRQTF